MANKDHNGNIIWGEIYWWDKKENLLGYGENMILSDFVKKFPSCIKDFNSNIECFYEKE